jgi:hypothetical protein
MGGFTMAFWASFVDSPHEVRTRTPDGRDLLFMTGTAGFTFQGNAGQWLRDDLYVLVGPAWRRVDGVAPVASLASIYNNQQAVNAGWATDNCRWAVYNSQILLIVALAVSDIDGYVLRASYQATALGLL